MSYKIAYLKKFPLGCEYGDRVKGCTTQHCRLNPSLCCGTCYSGPAIITPSQEPTTTEYKNPCKTALTTARASSSIPSTTTTIDKPSTTTQQTPRSQISTTSIRAQQTTTSSPVTYTATTPRSHSFLFRLTVTFMIDLSDDLSDDAVKESVISKVQSAVRFFLFFDIDISCTRYILR